MIRVPNFLLFMGITTMKAGFAASVSLAQIVLRQSLLAYPELPLSRGAREDDVGEFLDFFAGGCIRSVLKAGSTIAGPGGNGDKYVLLRPIASPQDFPELREVHLELNPSLKRLGSKLVTGSLSRSNGNWVLTAKTIACNFNSRVFCPVDKRVKDRPSDMPT